MMSQRFYATFIKPALCTIFTGVVLIHAGAALAQQEPRPGPVDPRIRTVVYDARQVVSVTGQLGYQMMVEFGANERIENISIGDAQAWSVTPNKKGNLLFLKPLNTISTNMSVVTNLNQYTFDLVALEATPKGRAQQTYVIQFVYPNIELQTGTDAAVAAVEPPVATGIAPENWNFAYSYTGAKTNVPDRVFDDGKKTYFQFAPEVGVPAVFVIGPDGKESLLNHTTQGRYFIVDQVARQFVLRSGSQVTKVFNDALKEREPGPAAPRARDGQKPKKRGLFSKSAE
jgi:type IV secretion system protein VirB9